MLLGQNKPFEYVNSGYFLTSTKHLDDSSFKKIIISCSPNFVKQHLMITQGEIFCRADRTLECHAMQPQIASFQISSATTI